MRRITVKGLMQAAAFLTVAFSLITLLPFDHHALQLFTHFRLQYLAASLLLLVGFAYLRSSPYAAALMISAVVTPWYLDSVDDTGDSTLKLLSANVLSTNVEHDKLFTLIAAEQPDLVFLQEVSPQWESALAALHADYPHHYVEVRDGKFGIALFSRLPLASVDHVDSFDTPLSGEEVLEGFELRLGELWEGA